MFEGNKVWWFRQTDDDVTTSAKNEASSARVMETKDAGQADKVETLSSVNTNKALSVVDPEPTRILSIKT